jgi:hypothetical protein
VTTARERLRALGRRRRAHEQRGYQLIADTEKAIRETSEEVPVTEAANLAGIHRSTAHEYLSRGPRNSS